jgi:hypothetical protein
MQVLDFCAAIVETNVAAVALIKVVPSLYDNLSNVFSMVHTSFLNYIKKQEPENWFLLWVKSIC